MVDPISPVQAARPAPRAEPSAERGPVPPADFSPVEAAVLQRLAESDFLRRVARAALRSRSGEAGAAPAEEFGGQDLTTLGGDTRGGRVNLLI